MCGDTLALNVSFEGQLNPPILKHRASICQLSWKISLSLISVIPTNIPQRLRCDIGQENATNCKHG